VAGFAARGEEPPDPLTAPDSQTALSRGQTVLRDVADYAVTSLWGAPQLTASGDVEERDGAALRIATILTRLGADTSALVADELAARWPELDAAEMRGSLHRVFDERLHQLAGGIDWRGGTC
jgi:hypothetical protein